MAGEGLFQVFVPYHGANAAEDQPRITTVE
jgi:hypothetical protein